MRTLTAAEVFEFVEASDGLGYCIAERINPEEISDPVLSTLWEDARELLRSIEDYLESHADDFDGIEDSEEDEDYD
jgi:hypothetical protein